MYRRDRGILLNQNVTTSSFRTNMVAKREPPPILEINLWNRMGGGVCIAEAGIYEAGHSIVCSIVGGAKCRYQ